MKITLASWTLAALVGTQACIEFKDDDAKKQSANPPAATQVADSSDIAVPSYEAYALDTAGVGARYSAIPANDSLYSGISETSAETKATRFPMRIPKRGAAALQLQVLLDQELLHEFMSVHQIGGHIPGGDRSRQDRGSGQPPSAKVETLATAQSQ